MQVLTNFSPMVCEQALGLIHLELDGEIDAHELFLLRGHLQGCESCRGSRALFARVKDELASSQSAPVPANLSATIRAQRRRPRRLRRLLLLCCLAVAGVVGLIAGAFADESRSSPTLAEEAAEIHALNLPLDVASKNRGRLVEALRGVGPVQVPKIEGFDVSGARVLSAGKKAQLVYRDPLGKRLSILVSKGNAAGSKGVLSRGLRYVKVGPLEDARFAALFHH